MQIKDRIKSYIAHKEISQREFERRIKKSNGYVNNIVNTISADVINDISKEFDDLNINWLITGEGEMLKENVGETSLEIVYDNPRGVPYFENIEATGSILSLYNDYPEVPTFYINYPHFDDCTAYVPMVGDSMFPMYSSGEIIAVKKVDNTDILLWGEAYLVVTNGNANSLRTVKLVHQHEDDSKIILRASNPNYRGDTVLNKADVISMFIVKGRIRRNQL